MVARIIHIGRGSRLDKGFIGQDEGSAGAGARLTTTRKRPSEELSTAQGEQLMIRVTAMVLYPKELLLESLWNSRSTEGK